MQTQTTKKVALLVGVVFVCVSLMVVTTIQICYGMIGAAILLSVRPGCASEQDVERALAASDALAASFLPNCAKVLLPVALVALLIVTIAAVVERWRETRQE